ncbi:hypothetical protein SAMN06893096_11048 [Geodermatophilus pulveris]|uniref:Uncharacterized protein n=1 Tax=Geodermatophilus pulveris TaxID=1564159 RepID=A0A239I8D2_9ACTN|nr:hypothetical protein [Geodermatophilus pulveris]SNS89885.1 hypothetical protein SAMN06893096_11048 [Geodermatophilus pulveris]
MSQAGRVTAADDALAALAAAADAQRGELAALLAATGGAGWPTGPGSRSPTRSPGRCAHPPTCPGCAAPGTAAAPAWAPPRPAGGYRPGPALDRWVRARDRRCRFPGCRRRIPAAGELDHLRR